MIHVNWNQDFPRTATGGSLATLSDVVLTGLADGDILEWDTATSKWINVVSCCNSVVLLTGNQTVAGIKTL
jgi:hypothetical protein